MQLLFIVLPGKVLALVLGIYYFKKLTFPYRLLLLQVLMALVCEVYGYYIGYIQHQNNIWLLNFYILFEAWLLTAVGTQFLKKSTYKKAFPGIMALFSFLWIGELVTNGLLVWANKFFIAYSLTLVVLYIVVLINCVFSANAIVKNPVFWIAISSILYFACVVPYKSLENYLFARSMDLAESLFNILLAVNFIRYPLVAFAIYLYGKQRHPAAKPG